MSSVRSRSSLTHSSSQNDPGSSISSGKNYSYLTQDCYDKSVPFGFGSSSPSRIEPKYPDTPGPGKYEPRPSNNHIESIRGHGLGFTSNVPRRFDWSQGNKNPSPCSYLPTICDHRVKPKIGKITTYGRRCSCYPDERESSMAPGPASYNLPELKDQYTTSSFKSNVQRHFIPPKTKHPPRFDGKTFTITRFDFPK
ncbi:hypothetical protein M9Y10_008939 [Tritrichomonas musculus]|uniref:Uncharacterized protein n=1 Tax=Tritrichomonas musculus TaxID=1915356 RepID=A0ABR2IZT8_9EUKA